MTSTVQTTCDAYGRYLVRMDEIDQSLRIIGQCVDRLAAGRPGRVMIDNAKIGWPAQLALGPDGLGNSPDHIKHIMSQSMEALIHHFKLVTEGFRVPAGQVYAAVEAPAASSAATRSATAGPGRTGCTSATRRSPTCRPCRPCARAAWWPTSSRPSPAPTR